MTDAPFADYDIDVSDESPSSSYQPTEDDELVLSVNGLYAKLLLKVSEYIGNQSDQPKVAALLQSYTQRFKRTNRPPPSLPQRSYDPESGKFVSIGGPSFKRREDDFFAQVQSL